MRNLETCVHCWRPRILSNHGATMAPPVHAPPHIQGLMKDFGEPIFGACQALGAGHVGVAMV